MSIKDRNGIEITIGASAVVMKTTKDDLLELNGKVGTVRAIKEHTLHDKKLRVRLSAGPEGDPDWSAWLLPSEVVIVPGGAP